MLRPDTPDASVPLPDFSDDAITHAATSLFKGIFVSGGFDPFGAQESARAVQAIDSVSHDSPPGYVPRISPVFDMRSGLARGAEG